MLSCPLQVKEIAQAYKDKYHLQSTFPIDGKNSWIWISSRLTYTKALRVQECLTNNSGFTLVPRQETSCNCFIIIIIILGQVVKVQHISVLWVVFMLCRKQNIKNLTKLPYVDINMAPHSLPWGLESVSIDLGPDQSCQISAWQQCRVSVAISWRSNRLYLWACLQYLEHCTWCVIVEGSNPAPPFHFL